MPAFAQTAYGKDQALQPPHKGLLFLSHVIENQQMRLALVRARTFSASQHVVHIQYGIRESPDVVENLLLYLDERPLEQVCDDSHLIASDSSTDLPVEYLLLSLDLWIYLNVQVPQK